MGVADLVPGYRPFTANIALLGHVEAPYFLSKLVLDLCQISIWDDLLVESHSRIGNSIRNPRRRQCLATVPVPADDWAMAYQEVGLGGLPGRKDR